MGEGSVGFPQCLAAMSSFGLAWFLVFGFLLDSRL